MCTCLDSGLLVDISASWNALAFLWGMASMSYIRQCRQDEVVGAGTLTFRQPLRGVSCHNRQPHECRQEDGTRVKRKDLACTYAYACTRTTTRRSLNRSCFSQLPFPLDFRHQISDFVVRIVLVDTTGVILLTATFTVLFSGNRREVNGSSVSLGRFGPG